ncbi:MAG: ribosome small subunit-dependent GTPase A [Thermodesulfobacteriota bacterium]
MQLKQLGFDQWFEAHASGMSRDGFAFARVSAVNKGTYLVNGGSGDIPGELAGRLAYMTDDPCAFPCVGDWVLVSTYDGGRAAIIHDVLPRKTSLRRKAPGSTVGVQMIAANIDTAFIVQSCHFDFNPNRLERYLAMVSDGGARPVVVLTKTDLAGPEELHRKMEMVRAVARVAVIPVSNVDGTGFGALRDILSPGGTYCLLGSSGVGKTTILNRLLRRQAFLTSGVSATGEGTHTTTRRQLIVLDNGAMIIDTPGMRELGLAGASTALDAGFGELSALAANCRYSDCTHRHEPGCAVRAAVESGAVPSRSYENYLKLRKESEHYEMSSLDKRRKDKAFGRLVKSVKKSLRK